MRIETDRLLLRPLTTADLDEVVEMHAMPEVVRTMGPYDRPAALARLERNEHEWAGWALRPDVWGQGFATEAGRACIDWGFRALEVPYLTAMIVPDNERSIGVATRLGMDPIRSDMLMDLPVVVYAIKRPPRS